MDRLDNPLQTLAVLVCAGDARQAGLEEAHFLFIISYLPACCLHDKGYKAHGSPDSLCS